MTAYSETSDQDGVSVLLQVGSDSSPETGVIGCTDIPLEINASEGTPFECPFFRGQVLLLNRLDPEPAGFLYHKHFKERKRRFEFRLQGKFLKDPGDQIFFGVELSEPVGLGPALRVTVNWIMSVVHILCSARGVTYSYSLELQELPDGSIVRPHLAFPMYAADAIIATPPGLAPPPLTETIDQMTLQERCRVRPNTTDTFTFAFWSKQADFLMWKICNMPCGWTCSFASFIGAQQVHLPIYALDDDSDTTALHTEARKRRLMTLTLRNRKVDEALPQAPSTISTAVQKWTLEQAELTVEEFNGLMAEHRYVTARSWPLPGSGWLNHFVCCTSTVGRHGLR